MAQYRVHFQKDIAETVEADSYELVDDWFVFYREETSESGAKREEVQRLSNDAVDRIDRLDAPDDER